MNSIVTSGARFSHSANGLREIAQDMLDYARLRGASAVSVEVSEGIGQGVTVRNGAVETIEYNRDKGLGITAYIGQQRGNASTSDFSRQAVRDTVDAALSIARYTAKDDCSGLPDPDMLAHNLPDLDLYHPWYLPVDKAIELARECEMSAMEADKRVNNSEGATVNLHETQFVHANSLGFFDYIPRCKGYSRSAPDRSHRGRTHGAQVERTATRYHASAGIVRGTNRIQPAGAFRQRGERQQPVSKVLVPARPTRQIHILTAHPDRRRA